MYVVNSEPAGWCWGEVEQARESKTGYPENRPDMKPDGMWGGGASYPGKPSCPVVDVARDDRKTESTRRSRSEEGQTVADSRIVPKRQDR